MTGELWRLDGTALTRLLRAGTVSARGVVISHLERLHAVNPAINAVVRTLDEEALAESDAADRARLNGALLGPSARSTRHHQGQHRSTSASRRQRRPEVPRPDRHGG